MNRLQRQSNTDKYDFWQRGHNILWTPEKAWRKKKKKYLFKNSCPEEVTPPVPWGQSSPDHLSRPSLILKTKGKKKGNKAF